MEDVMENFIGRELMDRLCKDILKDKEFMGEQLEKLKNNISQSISDMDMDYLCKQFQKNIQHSMEGIELCDIINTDKIFTILEKEFVGITKRMVITIAKKS